MSASERTPAAFQSRLSGTWVWVVTSAGARSPLKKPCGESHFGITPFTERLAYATCVPGDSWDLAGYALQATPAQGGPAPPPHRLGKHGLERGRHLLMHPMGCAEPGNPGLRDPRARHLATSQCSRLQTPVNHAMDFWHLLYNPCNYLPSIAGQIHVFVQIFVLKDKLYVKSCIPFCTW